MDIYSILASKPHNPHYLKRYIKFIYWCQQNPLIDEYTEEHHICPKATDFFPEYISFIENPWNCVTLTAKQHLICHVILWKAYPETSMSLALDCMLGNFNAKTNIRLVNRVIPTVMQIRYLAKVRKEAAIKRGDYVRGKSTYKDSEGNKYFIKTDDPLIQELNLVGNNSGLEMSEESKQAMRDSKFPNKRVRLYFLDNSMTTKLFSEEFSNYIEQGWSTVKTEDDYRYCEILGNAKNSQYWTNRVRYMTRDGQYHGAYLKDNPIIEELNLVPHRTEAQILQNASRVELATAAKLGTNIYNNGIEEKFLSEPIDETWKLGRLPYSEEGRQNQIEATRAACSGTTTYNDGKRNFPVKPGDYIDPSWVKGMKPQKVREFKYTDGKTVIKCPVGMAPEGFVRTRYYNK